MLPPHNCWVDLFCGSASLSLAKRAAPIEIINDIDKNVVNVFRQLREHPEKLIRATSLTPYSREEFELSRSNDNNSGDLENARRFLVNAMMSINGVMAVNKGGFSLSNTYSRNNVEARVSRWNNLPERLEAVAKRLKKIRIEQSDARLLLGKFSKRPATLVYIDPPYNTNRTGGYANDAKDDEFHYELLDICIDSKCMIVISGYENVLYKKLLTRKKGWNKQIIATHTTATCGQRRHREEVIWMNNQARKALLSGRVPIRLSKQERAMKKLNPIRR